MTTAGGKKSITNSYKYKLSLRDKSLTSHNLNVYGIDRTTNNIAKVELNPIIQNFENVDLRDIQRPPGEVDLLIGYDYAGWHPIPENTNGHLIILSNMFGKCVGGRYPSVVTFRAM